MNNKLFIATHIENDIILDVIREKLEGESFFDRYGDANLAIRKGIFGFKTIIPKSNKGYIHRFLQMIRCSYVYFPCGWHKDKYCRKIMTWAEILGKQLIFEEDSRCK